MIFRTSNVMISLINICKLALIAVIMWFVPPHVGGLFVIYIALDFMVEYMYGGKRVARRYNKQHDNNE